MTSTLTNQPAVPTDAFGEYAGKWVAIRGGSVIAAADSLEELRANPKVTRGDAVYVIPEQSSSFF